MSDDNYRIIDGFGKRHIIKGKIILHGGSPCQGFSFAGKMKGASTTCNIEITTLEQYLKLKKKDGFTFNGQSYLFWEYVRILRILKPNVWLLENVQMVKKWKNTFNDALGCKPIMINSALVSAQNRKRLYWTNIGNIKQPNDKNILLKDIILKDINFKSGSAIIKENGKKSFDYSRCNHIANATDINGHDSLKRVYGVDLPSTPYTRFKLS